MKYLPSSGLLSISLVILLGVAGRSMAAEIEPVATTAQTTAGASQSAPEFNLSSAFGIQGVIQLSHAQVSDDVIASYIQASGTVYNLKPTDIVNLHTQGVSDQIISLMIAQGRATFDAAATNQVAPVMPVMQVPVAPVAPVMTQPVSMENPVFIPGENAAEIAAAPPMVQEEAPSTLYVIPDVSGPRYTPSYTVFGGGYYWGAPSTFVRIGGRHGFHHSFHRH